MFVVQEEHKNVVLPRDDLGPERTVLDVSDLECRPWYPICIQKPNDPSTDKSWIRYSSYWDQTHVCCADIGQNILEHLEVSMELLVSRYRRPIGWLHHILMIKRSRLRISYLMLRYSSTSESTNVAIDSNENLRHPSKSTFCSKSRFSSHHKMFPDTLKPDEFSAAI